MANITFIIGNGFDLRIGLNTRYTDFYKIYTKVKQSDSVVIQNFKNSILHDKANSWTNWSDFELGMGQNCTMFNGKPDDFLSCLYNFAGELNNYLEIECAKISWEKINGYITREFISSLLVFNGKINSLHSDILKQSLKRAENQGGKISFLQLNYTNIFDKLMNKCKENIGSILKNSAAGESNYIRSIGANLHIHGSIRKYPVMGVDNANQITDETIRYDESVAKGFIKPNYLNAIQDRDVNKPIPAKQALMIIKNSTIICIYGASIGDTDKRWWQSIGEWLKSGDKFLIIFDVCGEEDDGVSVRDFLRRENDLENKRRQIIERFTRLAEWHSDEIEKNKNKIIIELDSHMFNFKLPKKILSTENP